LLNASNELRVSSTKKILVGTTKGGIFEALLEDNKDKVCKKLYDLNEADSKEPQPISESQSGC
jgi:hypothetical protein